MSKRQLGVFCAIVPMSACILAIRVTNLADRCALRSEPIGHHPLKLGIVLHRLLEKHQC